MLGSIVRNLVRPLVPVSAHGAVDIIVVLGAPLRPDGSLGLSARERVEAGVAAWRAGLASHLLFTGGRTDPSLWADLRAAIRGPAARERGERAEAEAMRELALVLGVPDAAILVESKARSTEENARFAAELMRERGLDRALLVSQPYHLHRSVALFRREGIEVVPLHLASSHIYAGGLTSLRALRWVTREYVILGLLQLRRLVERGGA